MTYSQSNDERIIIEYDDTTRAWNDLKHGQMIHKSFIQERFTISLKENTKMYMTYNYSDRLTRTTESIDIPSLINISPKIDLNCHVCLKYQGQIYPCRICGKVFHQQCLKDMGEIKSYNLIKNANNLIGWTCPICEDLRIVLSPNELTETNEWIKSLGSQYNFNLENYINTRIKSNNHMKNILQIYINTIADMTSNQLSQRDLQNLDISLKILSTSPKYLVKYLTSFELYRLSQLFISLSSIDQQHITYKKFNEIFNNYLQKTIPELSSHKEHLSFLQIDLEALAYSLLGDIINFDRTWSQFILDATIPTLLARYNHRTPFDFINRIVPSQQSTSPTSTNFIEYIDGQSSAVLINNVLQKLQEENESSKDPYKTRYTK